MALTPALVFTAVSQDGTTSTYTDNTVYGSPNPLRTSVAVYLTAYKVDEDLVETALTVGSIAPKTATTFTITNTIDGRYKIYFVILNDWLVGTTYSKYNVIWDPLTGSGAHTEKFYQYINNTPSAGHLVTDPTYWSVVTDPTTLIANIGTALDPGATFLYQIVEKIIDYQTAKCYGNVAILAAKDSCADDCDCSSGLCKSRNRIRTLLSVMRIYDTRQQYGPGEKAAREAETYCTDCGCLTQ